MRISDWSSDVCSSDLVAGAEVEHALAVEVVAALRQHLVEQLRKETRRIALEAFVEDLLVQPGNAVDAVVVVEADVLAAAVLVVEEEIDVALRLAAEIDVGQPDAVSHRSEEHTSELQSLMRISYAVFCLKKKTNTH